MSAETHDHTQETHSVDETRALGRSIGERLTGGTVIGLVGPLGAGKTHLMKGIAEGNGFDAIDQVTSPTFTLVNEYIATLHLYHLDAYRLESPAALASLGFDEMMHDDSAIIVEWADLVDSVLPDNSIWITITPTGDTARRVVFRGPDHDIRTLLGSGS